MIKEEFMSKKLMKRKNTWSPYHAPQALSFKPTKPSETVDKMITAFELSSFESTSLHDILDRKELEGIDPNNIFVNIECNNYDESVIVVQYKTVQRRPASELKQLMAMYERSLQRFELEKKIHATELKEWTTWKDGEALRLAELELKRAQERVKKLKVND